MSLHPALRSFLSGLCLRLAGYVKGLYATVFRKVCLMEPERIVLESDVLNIRDSIMSLREDHLGRLAEQERIVFRVFHRIIR